MVVVIAGTLAGFVLALVGVLVSWLFPVGGIAYFVTILILTTFMAVIPQELRDRIIDFVFDGWRKT